MSSSYNYTRANNVDGGGLNPSDNGGGEGTEVTWASIRVTTMFSLLQGLALFLFFLIQRYREYKKNNYTLYETRQFTRKHRSPPPYGGSKKNKATTNNTAISASENNNNDGDDNDKNNEKEYGMGPFGWAMAAYQLSNEDLLECVGADTFMYLRFLRLGFRITCFGSLLALFLLIPVYATGKGTGVNTREFNQFTLAKVLPNSLRLYVSVVAWYCFVAFVLREFWMEWTIYHDIRRDFYLHGDIDTPSDFRYTIMLEEVPPELRSSHDLITYFNGIFPNKVRQACVCYKTDHLNKLIEERKTFLIMYEQADAQRHAKPNKPPSTKRIDGKCCGFLGGKLVDTMAYAKDEIKWLNDAIDQERSALHRFADECNRTNMSHFRRDESGNLVTSTLGVLVQAVPLPLVASKAVPSSSMSSDSLHASSTVEKAIKANEVKQETKNPDIATTDSRQSSSLYDSSGVTNSDEISGSPRDARSSLEEYARAFSKKVATTTTTNQETALSQELLEEGSTTIVTRSTVDTLATSTAFVTFTSIVATNSAMQCNISGKADHLVAFRSPDPNGIIWDNITAPLKLEKVRRLWAAMLWTLGVLFWTIPVAFVTSLANLGTILKSLGIKHVDTDSFWYGLASGLLPVLALNLLTAMVPMIIQLCATKYIRMKRVPQVDNYVYFWHQLYQFANLWLIIIGGSIYSQVSKVFNGASGVTQVIEDVAKAMAGQSVFFVDMIVWGSFAQFGLELSMVSTYGMQLLKRLIQPEAMRTQRDLDDARKPNAIKWGYDLPPIMFVFLVSLVYMPIVPMIELFAAVYFGGMYIVWKHQCCHVYAQKAEGGGMIWERLFVFLLGCLYTSEACFIAYMGIKQAPIPSMLGFVPLGITFVFEKTLQKQVIEPIKTLALEIAGKIDREDGERLPAASLGGEEQYHFADTIERQVYGQPVLKRSQDEREPLPYRRSDGGEGVLAREERPSSSTTSGVDERQYFDCEEGV